MQFLTDMLSSESKISSKRVIGFASFMMLVGSWVANTFWQFDIKDQILENFMYITIVGLGVILIRF